MRQRERDFFHIYAFYLKDILHKLYREQMIFAIFGKNTGLVNNLAASRNTLAKQQNA